MIQLFLSKAWLAAHQAGNDDKTRQAMGVQINSGQAPTVPVYSEDLHKGPATTAYAAGKNNGGGHSV
jgi:hypothetical protein